MFIASFKLKSISPAIYAWPQTLTMTLSVAHISTISVEFASKQDIQKTCANWAQPKEELQVSNRGQRANHGAPIMTNLTFTSIQDLTTSESCSPTPFWSSILTV